MKQPAQGERRGLGALLAGVVLLLAAACSSPTSPATPDIAGTYSSEGGIDSFVSLELAPDQTYAEWFVGGTSMVLDDKGGLTMPRELRAKGTWKASGNDVTLTARVGNSRRLTLKTDGQRVWLDQPYARGSFKFFKEMAVGKPAGGR